MPRPYIPRETAKIYDLQNPEKQMSKSLAGPGCVFLLDPVSASAKKIRSAVTDTGREIRYDVAAKPGVSNLLVIHSALSGRPVPELEADYEGKGYGDLKKDVAGVLTDFLAPVQAAVAGYLDDPAELDKVLASGAERARSVAAQTLRTAYDRVGFLPPS